MKNDFFAKICSQGVVFLDNNGTTAVCPEVKKEYVKWISCPNPSSSSSISTQISDSIEKVKAKILTHCGVTSKTFTVIFTSGASESNCFVLRSSVDAYRRIVGIMPHIIVSAMEHNSVIDCALQLATDKRTELTFITPNLYGVITKDMVEPYIRKNTCIVSIMHANNETGSINPVQEIGDMCHKHKVPFHSDCVQSFGKYKINPQELNIDALSVSFHKFYGIKGFGLLLLNSKFTEGYELKSQINGSQQNALRGGTINAPAILSNIKALDFAFKDRERKNNVLYNLQHYMISQLSIKLRIPIGRYANYYGKPKYSPLRPELVVLGSPFRSQRLPNTVLLSLAKPSKPSVGRWGKTEICNQYLQKELDKHKIVVSIGSNCASHVFKSGEVKMSHVLQAMRAPKIIANGVIRVSMSDHTTKAEVDKFVKAYVSIAKSMLKN